MTNIFNREEEDMIEDYFKNKSDSVSVSREYVVKWEWFSDYDNTQYEDFLREEAENHIFEMTKEGYTSGELESYLEEDAVEIHGRWSLCDIQKSPSAQLLLKVLNTIPEKNWDGWEDAGQARQIDDLLAEIRACLEL